MSIGGDETPVVSFDKVSVTTEVTGQLAVSQRTVLQDFIFSLTDHPLFIAQGLTTGGSIALETARASLVLTTNTASTASAAVETKKTIPYVVGQAHTVAVSATLGAAKANSVTQFGAFNTLNGLYWQLSSSGLTVVVRNNTSGAVVNTAVARSAWNIDKLDGTGPSGFNLDVSKAAVFIIEYTWHGAGVVRFGIKSDKDNIYCHQFTFDNSQVYPYTRTPYLPIRAFVANTGTTASSTSVYFHSICAYVHSHLAQTPTLTFSASRGVSLKGMVNGSYRPLLAIRPRLLFNTQINRVTIEPVAVQVYADSQPVHVQLILNPATLTGASWSAVNTSSATEMDISSTAHTGGTVINEFYVAAKNDLISGSSPGLSTGTVGPFPLSLNPDGTIADVLLVVARTLNGSSDAVAAVGWKEFQ